jgi:hypothetical protein
MERSKLFPIIIVGTFLIDILFAYLMHRSYLNSGALSSDDGYARYITYTMFGMFFLSNTFYVLILLYFREHKLLTIYAAMMIIVSFCFAGYNTLTNYFTFDTIIIRLYAGISYFFGLANIIIATAIILQETHTKRVAVALLYFAVVTFIFGTLVSDFVRGYLVGFFGPTPANTTLVFKIYDIFLVVLRSSVIVFQAFAIRSLISVQKGFTRVIRQLY